jgi:hypothetical protein
VPFSDMTVEDLLRIVRSLPPEESAVQAVSRGLYYLDSRALAALLKELHKVGLSNRRVSIAFPGRNSIQMDKVGGYGRIKMGRQGLEGTVMMGRASDQ